MAPGTDPHAFEPSLADRAELGGADLVVANGLGLEGSLSATLDDVEDEGVAVVRMGDHVRTIAVEGSHDHAGEDDHAGEAGEGSGHEGDPAPEGADPHVWQDPTRVAEALPALVDALVGAGLDRDAVQACADDYAARLASTDARIAEVLSVVPAERRKLVTSHDAFGYFADRYGFEVVGTVIPSSSTLAETNPGAIEDLSRAIEAEGVPAVFAEAGSSSDDVDALAERVGAAVVVLDADALGRAGSGPASYIDLLESNAQAIADALG
jgi:zinc/manganese transport system substrate-binding protein